MMTIQLLKEMSPDPGDVLCNPGVLPSPPLPPTNRTGFCERVLLCLDTNFFAVHYSFAIQNTEVLL